MRRTTSHEIYAKYPCCGKAVTFLFYDAVSSIVSIARAKCGTCGIIYRVTRPALSTSLVWKKTRTNGVRNPSTDGEYTNVVKRSKYQSLLIRANKEGMTQTTATALIERLRQEYGMGKPIVLKFVEGHRGVANFGYTITLPASPYKNETSVLGKLRVGVVLHEFAHVVLMSRGAYSGGNNKTQGGSRQLHGEVFSQVLDKLISDYYTKS